MAGSLRVRFGSARRACRLRRSVALLATSLVAALASIPLPPGLPVPFSPGVAGATTVTGNLFYTRFCTTPNVKRATFTYDTTAHTFSLGGLTNIATTNGADGLLFAPNGNLLVGGQGPRIHEVNPNGGVIGTQSTPDAVFHLSLDPSGTRVYGAGIPGRADAVNLPLPPGNSSGGASVSISGSTTVLDSIAFPPSFASDGKAFYTDSGSGGFGSVGVITFTSPTSATTAVKFSGLPASHSLVYDPFTDTVILFGDGHITQISNDTTSPVILSDLAVPGVTFDQGTVDGQGHVYAADNGGRLVFVDYSGTGLVNDPANFVATPFLDTCLDDVAPLGVTAPPDLSVTKADSPDPVFVGQTLTYTVNVANASGNADATGVTVTDSLPAGTTFVSASPSQGNCSQATGTVTCNLGTLTSGSGATVTIRVTPTQAGSVVNTATVHGDQNDPNTSNNSATATTTVIAASDLAVTKTDAPDPAAVGNPVTYTLTATNNGPSPATGVTVTDTLPAGVTFNSATPSQGSCSQAAGVVNCNLGSLANHASATITIRVTPGQPGTIVNGATVSGNENDPDPSNNSATATTQVVGFGSGGAFVVGDRSATGSVLFWGAQWAKGNSLSGGSAPNAFKGFENSTATPTCGSTWTTDPGNSSDPPATIPPLMAVIVSSNITKSGSTISGNVAHIVIVRTDPGYAPNPGHEGTGTVVAVVC
jgi:uncharacterized repeat protein (TIGR01451 family)